MPTHRILVMQLDVDEIIPGLRPVTRGEHEQRPVRLIGARACSGAARFAVDLAHLRRDPCALGQFDPICEYARDAQKLATSLK